MLGSAETTIPATNSSSNTRVWFANEAKSNVHENVPGIVSMTTHDGLPILDASYV